MDTEKYFWILIILVLGYGALFYLRQLLQGGYSDNKAVISNNDLTGKTAIITGGNSGIGLGAAIHLAKLNANIIIACRNKKKAETAIKYIKQQSKNILNDNTITSMELDLSDLKSVQLFARKINENDNIDIDYLILNAGIYKQFDGPVTKNGLCSFFQINYLSHWYLTDLLLNKIKQTADKSRNKSTRAKQKYGAPVRIVSTSSMAHMYADIPLNNNKWNNLTKTDCDYGQSKLLQIIHMKQLQKELKDYNGQIQCVSISPGLTKTAAQDKMVAMRGFWLEIVMFLLYPFMRYLSRDFMTGSQVICHVCCNKNIVNGGYYKNCLLKESQGKNGCSNDVALWKEVYVRTQKLIKSLS